MIKLVSSAIILVILLNVSGCGDVKTIDDITYDTYGLFDEGSQRNKDIEYELIIGNIVWSIILVETIIAPVYFIGFSIYEPIRKKGSDHVVGSIEK